MTKIETKVGDSIVWKMKYKNQDNTPVNLTGFTLDVDAVNKTSKAVLFNILSSTPTSNMYITTDLFNIGEFSVIIKDTSSFAVGEYLVDVEYTSEDGFVSSSETFALKMVERL